MSFRLQRGAEGAAPELPGNCTGQGNSWQRREHPAGPAAAALARGRGLGHQREMCRDLPCPPRARHSCGDLGDIVLSPGEVVSEESSQEQFSKKLDEVKECFE